MRYFGPSFSSSAIYDEFRVSIFARGGALSCHIEAATRDARIRTTQEVIIGVHFAYRQSIIVLNWLQVGVSITLFGGCMKLQKMSLRLSHVWLPV